MTHEYKPHGLNDPQVDSERCVAAVQGEGRSISFHQCRRKRKYGKWCAQHYPPNVKKRDEERHRRWEAERKEDERRWREEKRTRLRVGRIDALNAVHEILDKNVAASDAPGTAYISVPLLRAELDALATKWKK